MVGFMLVAVLVHSLTRWGCTSGVGGGHLLTYSDAPKFTTMCSLLHRNKTIFSLAQKYFTFLSSTCGYCVKFGWGGQVGHGGLGPSSVATMNEKICCPSTCIAEVGAGSALYAAPPPPPNLSGSGVPQVAAPGEGTGGPQEGLITLERR